MSHRFLSGLRAIDRELKHLLYDRELRRGRNRFRTQSARFDLQAMIVEENRLFSIMLRTSCADCKLERLIGQCS